MLKKWLILPTISSIIFSLSSFALTLDEKNPLNTSLLTPSNEIGKFSIVKKNVTLMNIQLTPKEKMQLAESANTEDDNTAEALISSRLPVRAEVDMRGISVLDQGQHGSCVTFAITGALNTLMQKEDYISQLCSLELGQHLNEKGYFPSGWDGSFGPFVLDQLMRFGIVNKNTQKEKSCAGVTEYPESSIRIGNPLSLEEFNSLSENINDNYAWRPLLHITERFVESNKYDSKKTFVQVKEYLANQKKIPNMLTIGVLIPMQHCQVGACGKHTVAGDTWVMTKAIKKDPGILGGHEMFLIGYDDKAVAVDNEGRAHKGLFTMRNSWSKEAGDQGNYYMSYDFFKQYLMEVNVIYKIES